MKAKKKIDYGKLSVAKHKKTGGKLELVSKFVLKNSNDLSLAYTPGVASVCMQIYNDQVKQNVNTTNVYTLKKNSIAVVSDGSAVLGLGNIGANASIPVMEGKAVLMKHFARVDAFPICLNTQDTEEIIKAVKQLAPVFGGINLEDISAPKCFEIEERLRKELDIPVMHDDQWGAATVTLAGLINACKVTKKDIKKITVVFSGVGAAGLASIKLINAFSKDIRIIALDSKGIISQERNDLTSEKKKLLNEKIVVGNISGDLKTAILNADVFIGLSKPNILTKEDIKTMNANPVIFALANPTPEIMPEEAQKGGALVVATGRSDFPNQINNSIFFPGFWRGMLDRQNNKVKDASKLDINIFVYAANVIANSIKPNVNKIIPSTLDKKIHATIAKAILKYKFK